MKLLTAEVLNGSAWRRIRWADKLDGAQLRLAGLTDAVTACAGLSDGYDGGRVRGVRLHDRRGVGNARWRPARGWVMGAWPDNADFPVGWGERDALV